MKVELRTEKGVVGEITLENDGSCHGSNEVARHVMETHQIVEPGTPPKPLTAADGERYLRALPLNIGGAYFWATLVD